MSVTAASMKSNLVQDFLTDIDRVLKQYQGSFTTRKIVYTFPGYKVTPNPVEITAICEDLKRRGFTSRYDDSQHHFDDGNQLIISW